MGKICCTFYFNIAKCLKPAPAGDIMRTTCHQGEVHDAMEQDAEAEEGQFVFMATSEEKPKLKPIKGKRTGNIVGFVMTFPDLYPKFYAKFKKEPGKKKRRKSVYSPKTREEGRKSLKAAIVSKQPSP